MNTGSATSGGPPPLLPGRLDRLVPVVLLAALLHAGSTIWTITQFASPDVHAVDRVRLFARNLGLVPGVLVLLAAVFVAWWGARLVAFTPRLIRRARALSVSVLAVASFLAIGQLAGLALDLTPARRPIESFPTRGPAALDESAGVILSLAAAAVAMDRLRAVPG